MSRRKSGATSGGVVSGNASQNQQDLALMIRSNRGKLTSNTADTSDQQKLSVVSSRGLRGNMGHGNSQFQTGTGDYQTGSS